MSAVRFLPEAEREMVDAARYYESQSRGLGSEFLDKVELAIADIGQVPERWPIVGPGVRRRIVHRFPFCLLYRVDPDEIVLPAVIHLRRRPSYWLPRLDFKERTE